MLTVCGLTNHVNFLKQVFSSSLDPVISDLLRAENVESSDHFAIPTTAVKVTVDRDEAVKHQLALGQGGLQQFKG